MTPLQGFSVAIAGLLSGAGIMWFAPTNLTALKTEFAASSSSPIVSVEDRMVPVREMPVSEVAEVIFRDYEFAIKMELRPPKRMPIECIQLTDNDVGRLLHGKWFLLMYDDPWIISLNILI